MRRRKRNLLVLLGTVPLVLGLVAIRPSGGTVVHAFDTSKIPKIQQRLLDTAADIELGFNSPVSKDPPAPKDYQPSGKANECPVTLGNNVKVDQGCLNISAAAYQGRAQAHNETAIAVNPNNANQLLAASNDYKLGDGLDGGTSYSSDGGKTWQNSEVPLEFTAGSDFSGSSPNNMPECAATPESVARMYWQGGGDPSVAWDTKGNVYFAGLHFHRGTPVSENPDNSSGIYVQRSTGNGGASWDFPGAPAATCSSPSSTTGLPLIDKPYMTIDDHTSSPYTDRIYITWTFFSTNGTAYIYESHSSDYGRSFSAPVEVTNSSDSATLCANTYGLATTNGPCNENQFSDPFTGPDGNLYVAYDNYNNGLLSATDNHNQILLSESTDGGVTFLPAVQVANFNDLPDCDTYQGAGSDPFRACVPEKGSQTDSVFRATNLPSGSVSSANGTIAVTFGSYINADSNPSNGCVPAGLAADGDNAYAGVKTAGACSNKILLSVSTNGGASFTGTGVDPTTLPLVSQGASQAHTDQWWQWSSFSPSGSLVVSYYDRQYGVDETSGSMDITLSSSSNLATFKQTRVTSSSMPLPTEFADADGNGTFLGDYSGLAVANNAHPLWSDTRDVDLIDCGGSGPPLVCTFVAPNGFQANNEDIFSATVNY